MVLGRTLHGRGVASSATETSLRGFVREDTEERAASDATENVIRFRTATQDQVSVFRMLRSMTIATQNLDISFIERQLWKFRYLLPMMAVKKYFGTTSLACAALNSDSAHEILDLVAAVAFDSTSPQRVRRSGVPALPRSVEAFNRTKATGAFPIRSWRERIAATQAVALGIISPFRRRRLRLRLALVRTVDVLGKDMRRVADKIRTACRTSERAILVFLDQSAPFVQWGLRWQ
jgi:hypothetical protein